MYLTVSLLFEINGTLIKFLRGNKYRLPLVSRTLANFVRQNSKKLRSRLINRAKHLDSDWLKMMDNFLSQGEVSWLQLQDFVSYCIRENM